MDADNAETALVQPTASTSAPLTSQSPSVPQNADSRQQDEDAGAPSSEQNQQPSPAREHEPTGGSVQVTIPINSRPSSPPSATPSKTKVFLKTTAPDTPLHIFLPRELPHDKWRKLQITIRSHGGVTESRFGKADLIAVDPTTPAVSKKLLRDAKQIGQPIPVVILDYIPDSVSLGERIDPEDPSYKFDGVSSSSVNEPPAAPGVNQQRALNGRNPFTESDRDAVVAYFLDKDESTWSLNAAAKELAERIPTHTKTSFQTYLQANFEKGWNLKQRVLFARRDALESGPSELQARILRSRFTASPSLAEQSAPSDGWPSDPRQDPSRSSEPAPDTAPEARASSVPRESDGDDLEVRPPLPGSATHEVDKSPTKQGVRADLVSSRGPSSESPPPSLELPSGQRVALYRSPPGRSASVDEESDPETFSEAILKQLQAEEIRSSTKTSQSAPRKPVRTGRRDNDSASSSEDSDIDQLGEAVEQDSDADGTTVEASASNAVRTEPDDENDDSEWDGTRLVERSLRKRSGAPDTPERVKFTKEEKDELLQQLADYVQEQGHAPDALTQEALLAKPADSFWEQYAAQNPTHSAMSWRSHYLKNRVTYKQMIDLIIAQGNDEQADSASRGSADRSQVSIPEPQGDDAQAVDESDSAPPSTHSLRAANRSVPTADSAEEINNGSPASRLHESESMPADGIVVDIPLLISEPLTPAQADRRRAVEEALRSPPDSPSPPEEQWPSAMSPPPMDEEEDDMLQVGQEADPHLPQAQSAPVDESEASASVAEDSEAESLLKTSGETVPKTSQVASKTQHSTMTQATDAARSPQARMKRAHQRPVEAGTPLLTQHRNTTFVDFSMDSDEERRIRQARARSSLPNLAGRREREADRPMIRSERIFRAVATPSRDQWKTSTWQHASRGMDEERAKRVSEWRRSISASPSSMSPELLQDSMIKAETSRSRASRINRDPMLGAERVDPVTPPLQRNAGRPSPGGQQVMNTASASRVAAKGAMAVERPSSSKSQEVAARMQYRAEVERFRQEYGLNKMELREVLMRFQASVKDARRYIDRWLAAMTESYGVEAAVAFEYVKTSRGDFEQAESFLRLASITRPGSRSGRADTSLASRSGSHSASPTKRSGRSGAADARLSGGFDIGLPASKRSRR